MGSAGEAVIVRWRIPVCRIEIQRRARVLVKRAECPSYSAASLCLDPESCNYVFEWNFCQQVANVVSIHMTSAPLVTLRQAYQSNNTYSTRNFHCPMFLSAVIGRQPFDLPPTARFDQWPKLAAAIAATLAWQSPRPCATDARQLLNYCARAIFLSYPEAAATEVGVCKKMRGFFRRY